MKHLRYLSLLSFAILIASCESDTFLRSKKTLDKNIQGYWRPIYGTSKYGSLVYDKNVQWKFKDGELQIVYVSPNNTDAVIDKGQYSISTKIDNSFLTISGLKTHDYDTTFGFNIKWTIVQLETGILDIAGRPNNSGMVEIEFTKSDP